MTLHLTDGSTLAVDDGNLEIAGGMHGSTVSFYSLGEPVLLDGALCASLVDGDGETVVVFD